MKAQGNDSEKKSLWQIIFMQSKVNGALYRGEELPGYTWDWPKDTYLQRRLRRLRRYRSSFEFADLN
jgi:hypothetical protein